MRIALDLRSLMDGKISGVENYVLNLVNNFPRHDIFGFYNRYNPASFPQNLNKEFEVKKSSLPNKVLNTLLRLFSFPKFEKLFGNFDVLWLPDIRPFAIRPKTKLAVTVHDLSPIMHPEFYSLKRRIWHRLINYKGTLKRADIIFAVSEYTKFDLMKIFNVPENKIKVVYPGIDHDVFKTNLDQAMTNKVKDKYSLPEKYILSISTIEPRKNILGLIKAFSQLKNDCHLVIAGRLGWLYKDVLKAAEHSEKSDKIHFLGYVDEKDKPYLIAGSEVVCYPSFYEGFGFVPLEAMACGVPAVTSARTSMPEICADAVLLVEPMHTDEICSALDKVLTDRKLRSELISKGLDRVKRFSWQNASKEIYNQLKALA